MTTLRRAAVLTDYGQPFQIREYPQPRPGPGGLVVDVEAATVCGSDVHVWLGHLAGRLPIEPPLVLGHEMCGRVTAVGDGADRDSLGRPVRTGDRVVWAHASCGHCPSCTVLRDPTLCSNRYIGYLNNCERAPHFTGTFAEVGVVGPAAGRVVVPPSVSSAWAAAGSCALRTVVRALRVAGSVGPADDVLVQGAGPLGLFATALLSLRSPRSITVVGGPADRLALARRWGATHTVSVDEHGTVADRADAVRSALPAGPTVAFELAGAPGAFAEGVDLLAAGGRYVVMGTLGGARQDVDVARIVMRGLRVTGSMSGEIGDYAEALDVLERFQDRFDWDAMLGRRYGLSEVGSAMDAMRAGDEIKPVIVPGGEESA